MNSAIFVALPMLALSAAIMFLLPYLSPRRYFFAITVPLDFPPTESGRAVLRRYHRSLIAVLLLSAIAVWLLAASLPAVMWMAAVLLPLVGGMVCFLRARNQVRRYSVANPPIREAGLSTVPEHLPRWVALALPPFAAPLAAAAYLRANWDEIPPRFPVHFDLSGTPDRWAEKATRIVYGPLLADAGLMLLVLLLGIGAFHGARRGPQRVAVLKMIVVVIYFLAYMLSTVALMPLVQVPIVVHAVLTAAFAIGLLAWCVKLARDPSMPVDRTPDEAWRLGTIYYNPDDPAVFVQKRIGFGYTLNLGNRIAWVGIGIFVVAMTAFLLVIH